MAFVKSNDISMDVENHIVNEEKAGVLKCLNPFACIAAIISTCN